MVLQLGGLFAWLAITNGFIIAIGQAISETGGLVFGNLVIYGIPLLRLASRFFYKGYYMLGLPPSESVQFPAEYSRWVNRSNHKFMFVLCVAIDVLCLALLWYPR